MSDSNAYMIAGIPVASGPPTQRLKYNKNLHQWEHKEETIAGFPVINNGTVPVDNNVLRFVDGTWVISV